MHIRILIALSLFAACGSVRAADPPQPAPASSRSPAGEGYVAVQPAPRFHRGVVKGPFGPPRKVSYQVINGHARFEGDIDLGPVDAQGNLISKPINTAVGVIDIAQVWPDCVVPFRFDASVSSDMMALMTSAMTTWSSATPCTFPAHTTEKDYVTFQTYKDTKSNGGGHSDIGHIGGEQGVHINEKETNPFVIVHEIGHTLGLFHEHTRHDRDQFVTIVWKNIDSTYSHDFEIDKDSQDIGVYNFTSVMHYPSTAFGSPKGATTILPNVSGVTIGQRSFLDPGDISGAMEVQGIYRYWTPFETMQSPPAAASPGVIGPFDSAYYFVPFFSGGRDVGQLCRRYFPWYPPEDCDTGAPPEPLRGIPAATVSPVAKGETAIFVRGLDTNSYLDYRRDYLTNKAGGAFHLKTARAGTNWLSDPASITLNLQRIIVFGLRGRVDHPGETVVALVYKDSADGSWTGPIELPPVSTGPMFEPAVISTRPGIWTLFVFDTTGTLWVTEGNESGTVVTPWKPVTKFSVASAGPKSGPSVTVTGVPNDQILLTINGRSNHLFYLGMDNSFTVTDDWHDIGGLLNSRPSVAAIGPGAFVLANIQGGIPLWWRWWKP
ncbi:MAG TPA: M12 family metallopeptidase [Thermoanaerobaculia bacterium]|nr:M12 family metallopeptidase [Thermoanaerobaculia bacterium]